MTTLKPYIQDRNPKNTEVIWRELIPRKVIFGRCDYQLWVTDRKYEITRYNRASDDISTVLSGVFYDCKNDEDRYKQMMEDFSMLLEQIKEDYENRFGPLTEDEIERNERAKYQ